MKVRSLLALTITVALVPVVVFFAAPLSRLVEAERDAGVRTMQEAARATSLAVDAQWYEVIGLVRATSNSSKLESNQMVAFGGKARSLVQDRSAYLVLFDHEGRQLVNTSLSSDAALPDTRSFSGQRIAAVLAGDQPVISNLLRAPGTGRHVVALEFPVHLPEQRHYVISYGFDAALLAQALPPPAPERAVFRIYDRDGRLMQSNHLPTGAGALAPAAIADAIRSNNTGLIRTGDGTYTVLARSALSGWWIAMSETTNKVDGTTERTVLLSGLGLALALALAIATAWALSDRIAKAIAQTNDAARAMGTGNGGPPQRSGIDELDHLEDSVYQANRLLTEAALERERLLVQAQQAREVADAQNRAKDEFLAMLGHELRNPMAPISTAAHLLTLPDLDPSRLRHAGQVIGRQVEHMNRLVNDLLDVSRVTRGLISLERKPLPIDAIIASALEQAASMVEAGRHELVVDTGEAPLWISGDAIRLVQVLTNLLVNAVKYSPPATRIEVRAASEGATLVLSVADYGSGIEPDLLPRIFELFSQGARRPDRAAGGLGLGLALVRKIVELHGGSVSADSEGPGCGSCFTIRLPMCAAPLGRETA
ncbi:MAG: HAMP domain-containing histidine kinase [Burkholderiaceae bacterium]|nr:HAMP domain-containing histidine kinase [Burkholderiaceae bacterium]